MPDSCTESLSTPPNFASLPFFLSLFYPLSWQWPPFPCLHFLPYKIGKILILDEPNHQPFLDRAAERSWGESYDYNCKFMFSIFKATQQSFYFLALLTISNPDQWPLQTSTTLSGSLSPACCPPIPTPLSSASTVNKWFIPLQEKTRMRSELPQSPSLEPTVHLSHIYIHSFLPSSHNEGVSLLLFKTHRVSCILTPRPMRLCCAESLQSGLTLCNPRDCSPPGSSAYGILQARILERVAMPSSRGSSWPRDRTHVS